MSDIRTQLREAIKALTSTDERELSSDKFMVSFWTRQYGSESLMVPHQSGLLSRISELCRLLAEVTKDERGKSTRLNAHDSSLPGVWRWSGVTNAWEVTLADLTLEACLNVPGKVTLEERQRAARRKWARELWGNRPHRLRAA